MLDYHSPNRGSQYRRGLVRDNARPADVAAHYIAQPVASPPWQRPIVTMIERFTAFYPTEAYHHNDLSLNPDALYIRIKDLPKVTALKQGFPSLYRALPILVGTGA